MHPYEVAKAHYGDRFAEVAEHFLGSGLLFSDESIFILACTVAKDVLSGDEEGADFADCWFVEFFSGDMLQVFERLDPDPLPYVAFYRGLERDADLGPRPNPEKLRIYRMDNLRRHLMGTIPKNDRAKLKAAQKPPLSYDKFEDAIDVILRDKGMTQEAHDTLAAMVKKDVEARSS